MKSTNKNFFSSLYLQFQLVSKDENQIKSESDFIRNSLGLSQYDKVLDAACGNGRHSIELRSQGFDLTAIDYTKELIEFAKNDAFEKDAHLNFLCQDVRDLKYKNEFDAAYCFWGGFALLSNRGNRKFLRSINNGLKKGGRFLLDTHIEETLLMVLPSELQSNAHDISFTYSRDYNVKDKRVNFTFDCVRDNETKTHKGSFRLYSHKEINELLNETGFKPLHEYGSIDFEPFTEKSNRYYVVSEKI